MDSENNRENSDYENDNCDAKNESAVQDCFNACFAWG